jgi:hypothetical protein
MTERFPVPQEKRRWYEAGIRIIDIIIYLAILAGGGFAWLFTPMSVQTELEGWGWLIPMWVAFLVVGGLLGAVGRITRIWILEPPANVAAIVGIAIYFVVLGRTAFDSWLAGLATMLVLVAALMMLRRYFELQIFGTDPANQTFADRLAEALRRRTGNVPPREE